METVGRGARRTVRTGGLVAATLAALALAGARAGAQTVERDCRCVDADGNEIERCTCFRTGPARDHEFGIVGWDTPRARIGVSVDPGQDASFDARGARVRDVLAGGPADDAGIREGDVIVSLDGRALSSPLDAEVEEGFDLDQSVPVQRLRAVARDLEPGAEVEIEYERDGEAYTATLEPEAVSGMVHAFGGVRPGWDAEVLGERLRGLDERLEGRGWQEPSVLYRYRDRGGDGIVVAPGRTGRFDRCPGSGGSGVFVVGTGCIGGLELVALNPELGTYFGTSEGVLVADVHEDSPIGLEPGDVILAVGEREVDTPERARRILASYGAEEPVTFRIMRDRTETSVSGRLMR